MHNISIFTPALKKEPSETMTIADFVTGIKYGKWKKEVESVRNEPDDEKRKKLKLSVTGATCSGTFSPTRQEKNLAEHSGFLCIDIDGFTEKTQLLADPYTYALFSSISNSGLACLVKIKKERHKESFAWLRNYYFSNYGIVVDDAPSNPASLRFVSYDDACFINEKSLTSRFSVAKPPKINSIPIILPIDKVGEMVSNAVSRGINIADDYISYRNLGFALASGFGEGGRDYFHALSGISEKYNSAHCDRQYNFCLRNPSGKISVGTFYFMMKSAGIEIPQNDKYESAIRVAAIAKKAKRTESGVADQLHLMDGIPKEDAQKIAKEVFSRPDITLSSIAADPEKLIESLMAWMEHNHPMKKNIITGKVEENGKEITKERMNTIYLRARSVFNTPNINFDLIERIIFSDFVPEFHPIKDFINKNKNRNTEGNVSRLIATIKTPTPHADIFIRKWLISLIAAVHGDPIRLVLALLGVQNSGKTEFFRRLLPQKLKQYYGESKLDREKDDEILMCEKLILMDDEMSGKSRTDERRFKDLTSKNIFSLRSPYGRYNEDRKRLAVLCGTSNDKEIVSDITGNTRILPIEVVSIDHEAYNSIDKDELFMELFRAWEKSERWQLEVGDIENLSTVSAEYESIPFEREMILKYFLPADQVLGNGFVQDMTATEIKNHIETNSKQQIRSFRRLGIECRGIFGERHPKRVGGKILQFYKVVVVQNNGGENGGNVTDLSGSSVTRENIPQPTGDEGYVF